MRFFPPTTARTLRRQATLSALAMALFWSCAQQSAVASCGDYVMIGGRHGTHTSLPASPAQPHRCHGPGCRQAPVIPLAPDKIAIEDESVWGFSGILTAEAAPLAVHWWRDADLARARLCPSGIFRPPRVAA